MTDTVAVEAVWEKHYRSRRGGGARRPNAVLKEVAGTLPSADALDPRCGPCGDTFRLVQHGWHVTAVDVSNTAVERVRAVSRQLGLQDRVTGEQHDLTQSFRAGAST